MTETRTVSPVGRELVLPLNAIHQNRVLVDPVFPKTPQGHPGPDQQVGGDPADRLEVVRVVLEDGVGHPPPAVGVQAEGLQDRVGEVGRPGPGLEGREARAVSRPRVPVASAQVHIEPGPVVVDGGEDRRALIVGQGRLLGKLGPGAFPGEPDIERRRNLVTDSGPHAALPAVELRQIVADVGQRRIPQRAIFVLVVGGAGERGDAAGHVDLDPDERRLRIRQHLRGNLGVGIRRRDAFDVVPLEGEPVEERVERAAVQAAPLAILGQGAVPDVLGENVAAHVQLLSQGHDHADTRARDDRPV